MMINITDVHKQNYFSTLVTEHLYVILNVFWKRTPSECASKKHLGLIYKFFRLLEN